MSCEPVRPCDPGAVGLGLVPPPPAQRPLARRSGHFDGFLHELIATAERRVVDGEPLGRSWDIEGDESAATIASLWAYVAEGVAAYTELTASEAYLGTASDWMSLRRLAGLVGYRPRPRIAAQGWVRFDVERGADPLVPAGTRVQAPGTPERAAQTFETAADAGLRSEWNALTASWVPVAAAPQGGSREVRFLGDPGFRLGDRVLFVRELPDAGPPSWVTWGAYAWAQYWVWLLYLWTLLPKAEPLAVASVSGRSEELGTTLVEFDRDLSGLLDSETDSYAAYRVSAAAGSARRLGKVLRISGDTITPTDLGASYASSAVAVGSDHVVLDVALEELSRGQRVAVVDWAQANCDIATVIAHQPIEWEVSPGTPIRASRLQLEVDEASGTLPALAGGGPVSVYVVDRRIVARHYRFPAEQPPGPPYRMRLYPAPEAVPERVAVEFDRGDGPSWQVFACGAAADELQEAEDPSLPSAPRGQIVELDHPPLGQLAGGGQARASGNLVAVRHGTTVSATLGSGDATQAGQRMTTPDHPIAYDLDPAGNPVPSQVVRVDGVAWREVPTLYGLEPADEAFAVRLGPEGEATVEFGDGERGAQLPSGRNNVTATYRVGGGTEGEVPSSAITSLLGSVRGVRAVENAAPTAGGADQDDERRLRKLAPARARAFDRAVSLQDLVDLALGYPGVTHAAAWRGAGPSGCACGAGGLHLAFLRAGSGGPRPPEPVEITALGGFLDARRDVSVPLCVCAGTFTAVAMAATLALDPRRESAAVLDAAATALRAPDGSLAPVERSLGQSLDRSDVFAVLHAVPGVLGVPALELAGAAGELGRRGAERFELLALAEPSLQGVVA